MLSANGIAMKNFPCPAAVVFLQNIFASAILLCQQGFSIHAVLKRAGGTWLALQVAITFSVVLFSGMFPLVSIPVESVVVGRACGTGLVALIEYGLAFRWRDFC